MKRESLAIAINKPESRKWQLSEVMELFNMPFSDLLFQAQKVHRQNFNPNSIQISTLLSIKTGGCPEDCKYCPQSSHYDTELKANKLMDVKEVLDAAGKAKETGASRFCMGAAWRSPKDNDIPKITEIIKGVKALGLETCMTLGMLTKSQANALKEAGLDYYNHNIDTSEDFYSEIITTRKFSDRLDTIENVRESGMKVCCGGIVGMGEGAEDRAKMLITLANMPEQPESIPINLLVKVKGTPLYDTSHISIFDFVRTIAVARVLMPKSYVRLSAGREDMSDEAQALCFLAGANSIFYGEKLLTTPNPSSEKDLALFKSLGINTLN